MAPQYLKVGLLRVVGLALLAIDRFEVADVEAAAVFVALHIARLRAHSPRTLGVDFARESQVSIVAEGEVVAAVAQVEASLVVIAECRHDHARRVTVGEREKAERHCQRQRQTGKHHIGRANDYVLAGANLGLGELEIEVGALVVVARGVASAFHIVVLALAFLGLAAGEVALALLGDYVGDKAFFRLEVVLHGLGLIVGAALGEDGLAYDVAHGVGGAHGEYVVEAQVHIDVVRVKLDVAVLNVARAVHHG